MTIERNDFTCEDCGANTAPAWHSQSGTTGIGEYYMVQHELWIAATGCGAITYEDGEVQADHSPEAHLMLCIGCLEARLGRTLTPDDFIEAPINWQVPFIYDHSDRLKDRLGIKP